MRRIPVFFYGLFMDAELLRTKNVTPRVIGQASVIGFALRIGNRATLVPHPEGHVFGMLMELTHDEIDALYAESSVAQYRAEPIVALRDGAGIPALCFNLPVPPAEDERNDAYAAKLRVLGERLALPAEYLQRI